jgi:hypothetical protein
VASRIRLPTRILGDIPLGLGFLLGADCLNASLFGDIPWISASFRQPPEHVLFGTLSLYQCKWQ